MYEDDKFIRFVKIVEQSAEKLGCTFFIGDTEGHELECDRLSGEDISGWLVPSSMCDEFEALWKSGDDHIPDEFWRFYSMAVWDGNVESPTISFSKITF